MEQLTGLVTDTTPSNFVPDPPVIKLERVTRTRKRWWKMRDVEEFVLLEPIGYRAELGTETFTVTVPAPGVDFTTDFTSVPSWFTWLVPKSGQHLPAALIHDGLVLDDPQVITYQLSDQSDPDRTHVDRVDADTIFRDAMRDTDVGRVRRWVVWAAVVIASLVRNARVEWPWWKRLYYSLVLAGTVLVVVYLGVCASFDLVDTVPTKVEGWFWMGDLPWMPEGRWWWELLHGGAGAVVIPLGLSPVWLYYWRAGAIAGVALATLVHVTAAVAVVAALYWLSEWLYQGRRWGAWWLVATVVGSLAIFVCAVT